MLREVNERMTYAEAMNKYPDSYMIMCADNMESDMGTVLYVGDNSDEVHNAFRELDGLNYCGVVEGANHWNFIGGVVSLGESAA